MLQLDRRTMGTTLGIARVWSTTFVGWAKAATELASMRGTRPAAPARNVPAPIAGWCEREACRRGGRRPSRLALSTRRNSTLKELSIGVVALLALMRPAFAQSVEDFYRGKTVTIAIGFSVGGGYDLYARTLARYLGRHVLDVIDVGNRLERGLF